MKPLPTAGGPGPIEDLAAWKASSLEKIDGRPVVISVSGGKDSTALALLMLEAGIPFTSVHMDTGWEHQDTVDYVREYLPGIIGPIEILRSAKYPGGMAELVRNKGMFPSRVRRFCTQELKIFPFKAYMEALEDEPVSAVGIRAAESRARSEMPEWEESAAIGGPVWRPLIDWTEQQVINMHHRHNVKPNPLYLKGAERVGCWPCIFARKKEIRDLAAMDPGRIDYIRHLETELTEAARSRHPDGETFESLGNQRPSWFRAPAGVRRKGASVYPIDKVVEWSRTTRGGRQIELFQAPPSDDGCMRWGMCDTAPPADRE